MAGFLSKKQYAAIAPKAFAIKLLNERCRECSIWAMFLSSSLTVSMSARFLKHILSAMLADIMQIVMLETTETSWVKMYEDYDYLCITHAVGFATVSFTVLRSLEHRFFLLCIKKLAEFVCQTESFSKFILGEHSGKGLYIILLATQIYNFCRYFPNFQRVIFNKN